MTSQYVSRPTISSLWWKLYIVFDQYILLLRSISVCFVDTKAATSDIWNSPFSKSTLSRCMLNWLQLFVHLLLLPWVIAMQYVYLSIKVLLGRESYLIQKVAATQTTMSTWDCLTLAFQRIRFNYSLHSYLKDFLAWAQISKRLSQAPVLDSFTAGSSPVDFFTVNIRLIYRREHTAVQFASKSLS